MKSVTFVETPVFTRLIEEMGSRALLKKIQDEILQYPEMGDVIPGTGGIRKI